MTKALKEAKTHTSWIHPNEAYDRAVAEFVGQALLGPAARRFLPSFIRFQRRVARLGLVNSLSQLVLKMMSPGVPDFYQGTELWDLSLVDPDNRGAVDYRLRRRLLKKLKPLMEADDGDDRSAAVAEMLRHWQDARIKLYITGCGLRLRRRFPALFLEGDYLPLEVSGSRANHLVAFARQHRDQVVVVLVPRLVAALAGNEAPLPIGERVWQDTRISLRGLALPHAFGNVLTGGTVTAGSDGDKWQLSAFEALRTCPVAILTGASIDRQ
jgi:(1->4)-alpha-D-glucan 1-alpha-D-glucosylmutase